MSILFFIKNFLVQQLFNAVEEIRFYAYYVGMRINLYI